MTKLIFVWAKLVKSSLWNNGTSTSFAKYQLLYIVITKGMGRICPGIHSLLKKGSLYLHTCANIYSRISVERDQMVLKGI